MDEQKATWDKKHAEGQLAFSAKPSEFGRRVAAEIKSGDKVLELGCALGGDAGLFAKIGAEVVATDFSEIVIAQAKDAWKARNNLKFEVTDISEPFNYGDATFDIVYAALSLHYWDDEVTKAIFAEISRVLKPNGRLYFSCKSEKDPMYGEGEDLGLGVFVRPGRHGPRIRHFFSAAYIHQLVDKSYDVRKLQETDMIYSGDPSVVIQCWTKKKARNAFTVH